MDSARSDVSRNYNIVISLIVKVTRSMPGACVNLLSDFCVNQSPVQIPVFLSSLEGSFTPTLAQHSNYTVKCRFS